MISYHIILLYYFILLYYIIFLYHIIPYHIISYHYIIYCFYYIISYNIILYYIIWFYYIISYNIIIGKDCCERQNAQVLGKNSFIRIVSYYLPSQFPTICPHKSRFWHMSWHHVITLHQSSAYIYPTSVQLHICFQHLPSLLCIDCTD